MDRAAEIRVHWGTEFENQKSGKEIDRRTFALDIRGHIEAPGWARTGGFENLYSADPSHYAPLDTPGTAIRYLAWRQETRMMRLTR